MPGVHFDVSEAEYDAWPAVRNTTLGYFLDATPAHARYQMLLGDNETPAKHLGGAFHAALLEPERFRREFVVEMEGPFRSHEAKAKREAFREKHAKHTILTAKEWDEAQALSSGMIGHPTIVALLNNGRAEVSLLWVDPETGLMCKARLDWITTYLGHFCTLDLKTSRHRVTGFGRAAAEYGYHRQQAMYSEGLDVLQGESVRRFVFAVVEKDAPNLAGLVELGWEDVELGKQEFHKALRLYAKCLDSHDYPAYQATPIQVSLPAWRRRIVEDE